jgi:hypothetical protein
MSRWTHSICESCWTARNPDRQPVKLRAEQDETCCYCGQPHSSGIFVRDDPSTLKCNGQHEEDL